MPVAAAQQAVTVPVSSSACHGVVGVSRWSGSMPMSRPPSRWTVSCLAAWSMVTRASMPVPGNGGVVPAPCGDAVVAVDLTERHVAVGPSGQQFGGGVRPQRPGCRDDCSVQENAGAKHRIGACSRKFVDPAGGLGGGGRTAQDGGPEFRRDPGVGDEEGLTCGFDRGGDGRGTVLPPTIEDADVLAAQCFWPARRLAAGGSVLRGCR